MKCDSYAHNPEKAINLRVLLVLGVILWVFVAWQSNGRFSRR
jgi:hypothetical protein